MFKYPINIEYKTLNLIWLIIVEQDYQFQLDT